MNFETLFFTSLNYADLFAWQDRARAAHQGKHVARVDTWTIDQHPTPGGERFTLYACTMVLVDILYVEGEMRRTGI
jgi:hypothetical protein